MTNLIAISGRMGSGKDTAASILQKLFKEQYSDSFHVEDGCINNDGYWQVRKFAGKLKIIASLMTGIPVEKFEDQEFKKTNLGSEWDNMLVREFMQKLGTEAIRNGLHTNAWLNAMFSDFKPYASGNIIVHPNWIITDCRFQNEFDEVKARGGKVIFIERGESITGTHPSEIEMDQFKSKCDSHIYNNGSLELLQQNLHVFMVRNEMIPGVHY